jgi:Na+/H+-dicarboxylate symporter
LPHPPLEAVAVILGVDELMDMARTTVNLIGNCLATCIMARWEGELDDTATGMIAEEATSVGSDASKPLESEPD